MCLAHPAMLIRPLADDDIPAVASLFQASAREFFIDPSNPHALDWFFAENDEEAFRRYVAKGCSYHVAYAGETLAGFVAVRDATHLFHLFVDKRWHRQGVARRLWDVARAAAQAGSNPGYFTVNSSPNALPVYEQWGFVAASPQQCVKGLRFTPMRLETADEHAA
jgi:GNAT superfamily N-acetyltransferase